MDFIGSNCTSCNEPFTASDDIVVCPECGAPYHRACYEKDGECMYTSRHGSGFEYPGAENAGMSRRACANCGKKNPIGNLFCEKCGTPLGETAAPPAHSNNTGSSYTPATNVPFGGGLRAEMSGMYGQTYHEAIRHEYDGIPSNEWQEYIGSSGDYYLMQFHRMDETSRKTSICWSALIFAPMYFFYRKVWTWGIVSLLVSLLTEIPVLLSILQSTGIIAAGVLPEVMMSRLSMVMLVINWASSVAFGLFAFYLYRRETAKKLHALKKKFEDTGVYHAELLTRSGPSRVAVGCLFATIFLLSLIFTWYVGPEKIMNLYYNM